MNLDPADAQRVLACLGDPSRFRMVALLADGDRCVTDIAREVRLSQSCTTRHLQVLLRHAIVSRVRHGKRVLFQLRDDEPDMASLLGWALLRSRHETGFPPGRSSNGVKVPRAPGPQEPLAPGTEAVRPPLAPEDVHRDRPTGSAQGYQAGETEPVHEPRPDEPCAVPDLEDYLL